MLPTFDVGHTLIHFLPQIVQLVEDSYPSPKPCLKLKLTSTTSSNEKKVQSLKY